MLTLALLTYLHPKSGLAGFFLTAQLQILPTEPVLARRHACQVVRSHSPPLVMPPYSELSDASQSITPLPYFPPVVILGGTVDAL
ncbi:hypothetical protein F5I97DRAFT_287917 [Phlebopus sp. FC_14]|nr:hypothetical protein F5I97DRAFT_287917 [Phlebopus sp. FC_14]